MGENSNISEISKWPPVDVNAVPDSFGNILDSAVEGLRYKSGGHYGITDLDGKFGYITGENIQFYVGDIIIGGYISPSSILTPYDLANESSSAALTIARFLQTIDNDADPENGIQVIDAVHYLADGKALDFSNPGLADSLVAELTSATESGSRFLIPKSAVYRHFSKTLDTIIDGLADKLDGLAGQTICESDDQCRIGFLKTKDTHRCPTRGPLIVYSTLDLDQTPFDSLVIERENLIEVKRRVELAADTNDRTTGFCAIIQPVLIDICNASNRCEMWNSG